MGRRSILRTLTVLTLSVLSLAAPAAAQDDAIATGLNNPRKLFYDRDGTLYIAEAGSGGDSDGQGPYGSVAVGLSGQITVVSPDGEQSVLIADLVSIDDQRGTVNGPDAIYVTDECAGQQYQLFAVTRAWDEAQVTWTAAAAGATWQTAGGDRSTAILASIAPTGTGAISVPFVAQAVQAWVDDPAQNFGLVMLGDANLNGVDLASREAQDPSRHPRLTVTYR